jgi:hypothetical protein
MIYFNINIRNPRWWNRFDNIKCWAGSALFKNKFWEVQIMKSAELFRIEFDWTVQQDHAGVNLELGLAGYSIAFTFYDSRHWDTETNDWITHV